MFYLIKPYKNIMTNNNKTMNITDYLKNNCINFVFGKTDKNKGFIHLPNNEYGSNISRSKLLFEKNQDYIEKTMKTNMGLYKMGQDYNTTFIDTNEYIQLDCDIKDDEEYSKLSQEGINMLNKLQTNYPYYKSATKKYGFHFIIGKTSDITDKGLEGVLKNNSSICDYSNWSNDKPCEKLNSDYGFLEIFCGTPIWCKTFENINVENANKKLPKSTTQKDTTTMLKKILNLDFLKNKGKVKEVKQVEAEKKEKKKLEEKKKKQEQQKKQLEEIKIDDNYIEDKQDLILELTKLINEDLYLEVSSTFHNIVWSLSYNNCNTSLEYIKDIGKKSSKCNNKIEYNKYFDSLVDKGKNTYQLNIGVIYNLARQSNNKKYIELLGKNNSSVANITLAELFMKSYDGDIILLRLEPDSPISVWFYNKDKNIWSCESSCEFKTLTSKINKFALQYISKLQDLNDCDYSKTIGKFMDSLEQSIKIKNFIVGELIEEPKTIEFDNKPHLIPFKNKIFNTKTCKFEEHRRDNYITLTLDYDFRTIKETEEEYINAKNYFEELFLWKEEGVVIEEHSHRDIMNDVLFIIANCFVGRDKGEHFFIFNGKGGNGKSKLFDLLRMILDKNKYYGGVNGNLLCADFDPNKPSPDIANLQNKRVNVLQEPSENKLLNISAIKYLTGEDTIRARKLFKNPVDFVFNATNILVCNQRLGFEGVVNEAIIRRIIDIYLPFVFSNSKINKDKKIYKKKGILNLQEIKMGFINYMLNYITNFEEQYKKNINYIDYKFSNPTMERTKNYLLEYDYLGQFLDRYLIRTENVSNEIKITDIHKDFKKSKWYKDLDDGKQRQFDSGERFKKKILAVEEYNDIQYDDTKNKKGWKFVYCIKNEEYDITEDTEVEFDPEEIISDSDTD